MVLAPQGDTHAHRAIVAALTDIEADAVRGMATGQFVRTSHTPCVRHECKKCRLGGLDHVFLPRVFGSIWSDKYGTGATSAPRRNVRQRNHGGVCAPEIASSTPPRPVLTPIPA